MRRRLIKTQGDRVAQQIVPSAEPQAPPPETKTPVGKTNGHRAETTAAKSETSQRTWGAIVDDVVRIDVRATYEHLRDSLSLGDGVTEYGTLLSALDQADRNYVDAVKLARATKLEEQQVDRKVSEELEVLRSTARDELEHEKSEGKRSKAPTIQDIEDRMMSNWPTKVHELRRRSEEMHAARAVAEGIEVAWKSRAASLRSMVDRYAPSRLGA